MKGRGFRHRSPSDAELELWTKVTADVRPFRQRPIPRETLPAATATAATPVGVLSPSPQEKAVPPRRIPPVNEIDHKTRTKLRRGRLDVDAKLDLHGMRQHEAQRALIDFLYRCQANGGKVAIVVTGKGLTSEAGGVLRRMVPMWLQAPQLRDVVSGYGEAARNHGGEGALYVRIRRRPGCLASRDAF
jgi:DNA-nicking Smr family endonuclease